MGSSAWDEYNAPSLTRDDVVRGPVKLPFIAVQATTDAVYRARRRERHRKRYKSHHPGSGGWAGMQCLPTPRQVLVRRSPTPVSSSWK